MKKTYLPLIIPAFAAIFALTFTRADRDYASLHQDYPFKETFSMPYYAHAFSFMGFRAAVSDFLWMDIVQYIGDPENAKTKYRDLYLKTENLIHLDPNFTFPYLSVSGIYMFELKDPARALGLIDRGIEKNPDYWVLQLYRAAYVYQMNFDASNKLSDLEKAALRIEKAVGLKGHPPMLERTLGSFYLKLAELSSLDRKKHWMGKAVRLWANMYEFPSEELNGKYAETHLRKYGLLKN